MQLSDFLRYGLLLLGAIAIAGILFGSILGQPIGLGYVETDSMSPTLQPGDGFIAIPMAIAGEPTAGDVVTFHAEELHGGGLTTHRVVERTEVGYITKGDANPFSDQAGAEPPVERDQIVAKALEFNGHILVIPAIGSLVSGIQGVILAVLGVTGLGTLFGGDGSPQTLVILGGAIIGIGLVADAFGSDRSRESRNRRRPGYLKSTTFLVLLILVVIGPATASMVVPSGTNTFNVVSSASPNANPFVVGAGETVEINYQLTNDGYIPVFVVMESTHAALTVSETAFFINAGGTANTTVQLAAPSETGVYEMGLSRWRYLPILPRSFLLSLHHVHPFLAIAVIDLVLLLTTVTAGLVIVGLGPIRLRSASRQITIIQQVKRRLF